MKMANVHFKLWSLQIDTLYFKFRAFSAKIIKYQIYHFNKPNTKNISTLYVPYQVYFNAVLL